MPANAVSRRRNPASEFLYARALAAVTLEVPLALAAPMMNQILRVFAADLTGLLKELGRAVHVFGVVAGTAKDHDIIAVEIVDIAVRVMPLRSLRAAPFAVAQLEQPTRANSARQDSEDAFSTSEERSPDDFPRR